MPPRRREEEEEEDVLFLAAVNALGAAADEALAANDDIFGCVFSSALSFSRRVSVAIQNAARCEVKSFKLFVIQKRKEVFVRAIFNLGFCTKKVPKTHA